MVSVARMTHNVVNKTHNVARIRHQGPCSNSYKSFKSILEKNIFKKDKKKSYITTFDYLLYISTVIDQKSATTC